MKMMMMKMMKIIIWTWLLLLFEERVVKLSFIYLSSLFLSLSL